MVETRRKRKENPNYEKKNPSSKKKMKETATKPKLKPRVKYVLTAAPPVEETATETASVEKMTEPINVLVDAVATVEGSDRIEQDNEEDEEGSDRFEEDNEEEEEGSDPIEEDNEEDEEGSDREEDDNEDEEDEERTVTDEDNDDAWDETIGEKDKEPVVSNHDKPAEDSEVEESEHEEETELGGDNLNEEAFEPTEAIKPCRMFFDLSEYNKQIKLGTRCFILEAVKTLENLRPKLNNSERNWFEEHPQFRHFFHMKREKSHKVQGMWMLLMRTCEIVREREVWFIVNGVPIRYGLREHALLSGLSCCNYPLGYKEHGSTRFVDRYFRKEDGELGLIRLEDVKDKLVKMGPHRDRLKMAVLYFLGSVICAQTKTGVGARNVLEFFQRAVDDLDFCKTFPWGRYSYEYMLKEISHTIEHFGGLVKEKSLWPLPGFCVPLEILAFEAIPKLGNRFRAPVVGADANCPRMCRWSFKPNGMRGMPLSEIYQELGGEKIVSVSVRKTRKTEVELS